MPAQKRSHDASDDDLVEENAGDLSEDSKPVAEDDGDREFDRTPSSESESNGNIKDDYITVRLAEVRKEVQCPICLGIIRKTRTVMECLHRFCRECIDKSMRMGNNECPACRTHCASRRSLRDDPNYDALIAALYPDIDKYEEEELALHDDEKARNKQIQAHIAMTLRRQSEALGRKKNAKSTAAAFARRSQGTARNLRGRRNSRNLDNEESEDNEDTNGNGNVNNDSSSADERTEQRPKRTKRSSGSRYPQSSLADGGGDDNEAEALRDTIAASLALVGSSERLSWGKGGMRSQNRHGGGSAANGKNVRNTRVSRLVDHLRNSEENPEKFDINLVLVSVDQEAVPTLKQPYLSCRPTLSIKHLSEHVAHQTALEPDDVEIHLVKQSVDDNNPAPFANVAVLADFVSESKGEVLTLREQQTLAELRTHSFTSGFLLLSYQKKQSSKWQTVT